MSPTISVIIVNYKSEPLLKECLVSIYEKFSEKINFEITIVNNDRDASLDFFLKKYPAIKIIEAKTNLGFGGGVNLGAATSSGDILLFLNPDAQIETANIQEIISEFTNFPATEIIGSGILDENNFVQKWSAGLEISLKNLIRNNLHLSPSAKIWNAREKINADWVSGTALFIKKDLFQKLGGFDEKFFMYFEDMDLCKRARNLGSSVVYFPRFSVKHAGGKSYRNKSGQKYDYYRSQELYFKKHRPPFEWIMIKIIGKIFF